MEKRLNSLPSQGNIHGFESRLGHQLKNIGLMQWYQFFLFYFFCFNKLRPTAVIIISFCFGSMYCPDIIHFLFDVIGQNYNRVNVVYVFCCDRHCFVYYLDFDNTSFAPFQNKCFHIIYSHSLPVHRL